MFHRHRNLSQENMAVRHDFAPLPAPATERRPSADEHHGITRIDDYAWLRADNWQEVFRDPDMLEPDIRSHLEAENAYQSALMADTADLQAKLFQEMKGRIKEDDSSVPMKDGPFAYGSSFKKGGEQDRSAWTWVPRIKISVQYCACPRRVFLPMLSTSNCPASKRAMVSIRFNCVANGQFRTSERRFAGAFFAKAAKGSSGSARVPGHFWMRIRHAVYPTRTRA